MKRKQIQNIVHGKTELNVTLSQIEFSDAPHESQRK